MKNLYLFLGCVLVFFCSSCETQVDLNLHHIEPKLVIDASIGHDRLCQVILTKTRDYDDPNSPEYIEWAKITLEDSKGYSETLVYTGKVYLSSIYGQIGETYTLSIEFEGQKYVASDQIPSCIPIADLDLYRMQIGNETKYYPQIAYQDPPNEENYYYQLLTVNHKTMQQPNWGDDKNRNGLLIKTILFFDKEENNDQNLQIGDHIKVEMQTLGKGAYTFYKTISSPGGSPNSNPQTNFTPAVLGMFKTYSSSYAEKTLTAEDFSF